MIKMFKPMPYFDRSGQPAARPRPAIRPLWVETADERCPLACVWFALPDNLDEQDDDPGSTWPAFSRFPGGQAVRAAFISPMHSQYSYSGR